ncbi:MAG: hypothetical protein FWE27_08930 [Defluviitaleaceae bacterium]|nr:hypothetical protein [Defluviitaleaceae bacterium]
MRIIATEPSENAILTEIAELLQNKGVFPRVTKYEDGFGVTVWSVSDLDNAPAAEEWSQDEKIRFMEQYGDKIGGATEDSWVKINSYIDLFIADRVENNNAYIEKHSDEFDKTKFYLDVCGGGWVRMVYFNPDSNAGGQLVYDLLSDSVISEAGKKCEEDFWNHLYEHARQTLMDIDRQDFMSCAEEFVEDSCSFTEQSSETMVKLIQWADNSLKPK